MIASSTLSAPDGDSDQINFLNAVTQGATAVGSVTSSGPRFSTGTNASKKQAASVQHRRSLGLGAACFYPYGPRRAAKAVSQDVALHLDARQLGS